MNEFREALRAETRRAHDALDAHISRLDLVTRDDYLRLLLLHSAALPGLEAEIARLAPPMPEWSGAMAGRMDALRADLADLDAPPAQPLPTPTLSSPEAALGALYVLEGSRLGARVLIRTAQASLDPRVRGATRYLAHGQQPGLWPNFIEFADGFVRTAEARAGAVDGAHAAFAAYGRAADRWLPADAEDGRARV